MKKLLASAALGLLFFVPSKAHAAVHDIKIVEVFSGSAGGQTASYVMLQMLSPGQTATGGTKVIVYDAAGNEVATPVTLNATANGDNGATILIGTPTVQAAFGVTPDYATMPALTPAGGAVCFNGANDCFAWGNYTGTNHVSPVGTPFAALSSTQAAKRKGGTTDTNDSANDFELGTPAPKNNTKPAADAGSSSGSSGSSGTSGTSGTSGVGTTPTDGGGKLVDSGASSGNNASGGGSSGEDDGGCNVSGDTNAWTTAPLLALIGFGALSRLRRRRARTPR